MEQLEPSASEEETRLQQQQGQPPSPAPPGRQQQPGAAAWLALLPGQQQPASPSGKGPLPGEALKQQQHQLGWRDLLPGESPVATVGGQPSQQQRQHPLLQHQEPGAAERQQQQQQRAAAVLVIQHQGEQQQQQQQQEQQPAAAWPLTQPQAPKAAEQKDGTGGPKMNLLLLQRHHQQLVEAQRGLQDGMTQLYKQVVMQQNCALHQQLIELQRAHKKVRNDHALALQRLQLSQKHNSELEARLAAAAAAVGGTGAAGVGPVAHHGGGEGPAAAAGGDDGGGGGSSIRRQRSSSAAVAHAGPPASYSMQQQQQGRDTHGLGRHSLPSLKPAYGPGAEHAGRPASASALQAAIMAGLEDWPLPVALKTEADASGVLGPDTSRSAGPSSPSAWLRAPHPSGRPIRGGQGGASASEAGRHRPAAAAGPRLQQLGGYPPEHPLAQLVLPDTDQGGPLLLLTPAWGEQPPARVGGRAVMPPPPPPSHQASGTKRSAVHMQQQQQPLVPGGQPTAHLSRSGGGVGDASVSRPSDLQTPAWEAAGGAGRVRGAAPSHQHPHRYGRARASPMQAFPLPVSDAGGQLELHGRGMGFGSPQRGPQTVVGTSASAVVAVAAAPPPPASPEGLALIGEAIEQLECEERSGEGGDGGGGGGGSGGGLEDRPLDPEGAPVPDSTCLTAGADSCCPSVGIPPVLPPASSPAATATGRCEEADPLPSGRGDAGGLSTWLSRSSIKEGLAMRCWSAVAGPAEYGECIGEPMGRWYGRHDRQDNAGVGGLQDGPSAAGNRREARQTVGTLLVLGRADDGSGSCGS